MRLYLLPSQITGTATSQDINHTISCNLSRVHAPLIVKGRRKIINAEENLHHPIDAGKDNLIKQTLGRPDIYISFILLGYFSFLFIPVIWAVLIPLDILYSVWFLTRKARLPYRLPARWKKQDYSNPVPGSTDKFRKGEGLLFLGNDYESNEELWISNDDARRHAMVLGTTGSGKSLTSDTLVLGEFGWMPIGDLQPGNKVRTPSGQLSDVLGVYPQGRLPVVRIHFEDGRFAECSRDHLWWIKRYARNECVSLDDIPKWETISAGDLGIQMENSRVTGGTNPLVRYVIPLVDDLPGCRSNKDIDLGLGVNLGIIRKGKQAKYLDQCGSMAERKEWLRECFVQRGKTHAIKVVNGCFVLPVSTRKEGLEMRHMIWSVGGLALMYFVDDKIFLKVKIPGLEKSTQGEFILLDKFEKLELEIVEVEGYYSHDELKKKYKQIHKEVTLGKLTPNEGDNFIKTFQVMEKDMTCIKIASETGLFIMESYLITHNTELLLGMVSQAIMWNSGFLFVDGKGTTEFHGRTWSLVSKFGREDDYRILNFTDLGGDLDNPAGGPLVQSNTLNPFSHGTPDQLMNLVVSLMSNERGGADMWKHRAMSLVTSAVKALCEMRDAGDVLLNVQSIRDYLPLGEGVNKSFLNGQKINRVADIPDEAWADIRSRGGMIELYLRSIQGEFSETSRLALKGFFDSLPGFSLYKAINGLSQEGKTVEQHGFLSMQLTKPLGSLADDYGHIFRTPFGEVDIEDVVLNRRILVVLLPALQKAPEEMQNCGRIIVAVLKMMMSKVSGSHIMGSKAGLVDAKPTRAPTPFMVILDEAGYYMVKGIDIMMAQARSLGFMIVISGQDMAAMQAVSPQIAESASANARLTIAGAMEDAQKTWNFLNRKFSTHRVPVVAGRKLKPGALGTRWVDRPEASFVLEDRVKITDLQKLREGEFYFLMGSNLVKAKTFYTGQYWVPTISANKFLLVRGPTDKAPGLDQSRDEAFMESLEIITKTLLDDELLAERQKELVFSPKDELVAGIALAEMSINQGMTIRDSNKGIFDNYFAGMIQASLIVPDNSHSKW